MATGYVVVQVGYDYNDEIYSRSDSGGNPTKIYLNYQKAQAEVNRLNMQELLTCEIGQYAYDLEDIIIDMAEFEKILRKYDTKNSLDMDDSYALSEWFTTNSKKFSSEDMVKVCTLISLNFYELVEVEFDDSVVATKNSSDTDNRFKV